MTMEIKILSPKEDGFVKKIDFNFDDLKTEIQVKLEKYQGLAYTDDTIKDAKADRATLNKFTKALNSKKQEIKKQCLAPYTDFEAKIKELTGLVDEPLQAIDAQVKGYEERKRQEKQAAIEEFWDKFESNVKTLVPLNRIFNPKWTNATYAMSKIEDEIETFFKNTETELATIEELETEFEDQVIRVYLNSFSIAAALAENKKLLEQKAKREAYAEQQRLKREAEEKARQEAVAAQPTPEPKPDPVQQPASPLQEEQRRTVKVQRKPEIVEVDFRVHATREQLQLLKSFLADNGITFGPVPSETKEAA